MEQNFTDLPGQSKLKGKEDLSDKSIFNLKLFLHNSGYLYVNKFKSLGNGNRHP